MPNRTGLIIQPATGDASMWAGSRGLTQFGGRELCNLVYENVTYSIYSQTGSTAGRAERIDNVAPQSRAYPEDCTADIPYEYASALTTNTSDVPSVVMAGAGVGKL